MSTDDAGLDRDQLRTGDNPGSRRLRVSGLATILFASLVAAWPLSSQFSEADWLSNQSRPELAVLALLSWVVANLFSIGLLLLLSGLRYETFKALRTKPRAFLVKLAGANVLFVLLLAVNVEDSQSVLDSLSLSDWVLLGVVAPALALVVLGGKKGVQLLRKGWMFDAAPAEIVVKQDTRPPVLYVRSFKDDAFSPGWLYTQAVSIEQEIVWIMAQVGPVIAIGRPGESLPELGAARLYVGDDQWQAKVTEIMLEASMVVVLAGTTANLWWEIGQAARQLPLQRVLIVCPGMVRGGPFLDEIEERFGACHLPEPPVARLRFGPLALRPKIMGLVIYFSEDSVPHAEYMGRGLSDYAVATVRPFRGPLTIALRRVFEHLGLPWRTGKSRATAVLITLGGGMFGLQHFYLGYRRRGVLSVLFCWTGVPLVWGIVHLVRLVWVNGNDFEAKFVYCGVSQKRADQ